MTSNFNRFFVLIIIFFLYYHKIPGAIAITIIIGLILSLVISKIAPSDFIKANFPHWDGWEYQDFQGLSRNISTSFKEVINVKIWTSPTLYIAIFVFLFVDFFDSTGTFYAMSHNISIQTGTNYTITPKALVADAIGIFLGGILGCSTITTVSESNTGIVAGARTGFAAVITSLMFLVAIVLFPIFKLITPAILGAEMIFIGTLMMMQIKDIEWIDVEVIVASFFTILVMIITFSITNGIAIGFFKLYNN